MSFLNTVPLVWGLLEGPQRGRFDLSFAIPAECADRLEDGRADIGIVPAVEVPRLDLEVLRDEGGAANGIACHGPVRSILLVSKVPVAAIRTLATDSSSRTSVMLARILLAERWGIHPPFHSLPPDLTAMLGAADAALLIGDAALRVDPARTPLEVIDLGQVWNEWTGLPMVFAVWAAHAGFARPEYARDLAASCRYGLEHIHDLVRREAAARRFAEPLVREYLTRHVVFELGPRDFDGLELFLEYSARYRASLFRGAVPA